ncbi:hypothetical protein UFOVP536_18 [uncultured Caudovirales phage]|uniref:Uncharacterized protein n=1 Tax=uncultured Caudovirales phage TaxID=2100421 RepID=A0A6J5MRP8_9CAUD|nr:hypothetical protein UFOVP536_18 [uncultured Caudovirales phage]
MSEETTTPVTSVTDEALAIAQEAQSPKVFNLADLIKNRAYPVKDVQIYLDEISALKMFEIRSELYESVVEADVERLEAEIAALADKIKASALTFTLRGVSQEVIERVLEECNALHGLKKNDDPSDTPGWMRDYITILVGLNIEKIVDADGNVDDSKYDFTKANDLRVNLPSAEWSKLVDVMQKLTLAGGYFDQLTDAGFLPRS